MSNTAKKRTIDSFFAPPAKKLKSSPTQHQSEPGSSGVESQKEPQKSFHSTYPFPIPEFGSTISEALSSLPSTVAKPMNDQLDLDLLYFQPFIPKYLEREVFEFLRRELPFYRVEYDINRGGFSTHIKTPRYTTVFGLDSTSTFTSDGSIVDAKTGKPVLKEIKYSKITPRPIPDCLDRLRLTTEAATGETFNFCLVNYYASGSDSISYHSDDEAFLGPLPAIASFSLGARRDFLMKHKPIPASNNGNGSPPETKPIKLPLGSGDMILMRGRTQSNWLHSIPKRTGKNAEDGGRINITFRKAIVRGGTENYYRYNVGTGPVLKWNQNAGEMQPWQREISKQ